MIRKLKYATIADIGVFNLTYYDKEKEDELINKCNLLGITYLPSREGNCVYKITNNKFVKSKIEKHLLVNPYDLLFHEETIQKFKNLDHNEIRFIVEEDIIKGVVHIVDYNNEFIYLELYKALFRFENFVRDILIKNKFTNNCFIQWVYKQQTTAKKKNRDHWIRRYQELVPDNKNKLENIINRRKTSNPFQTFYLRELIEFAISENLIPKKDINIFAISSLRNKIAHSKDMTSRKESENNIVYNFHGLEEFINEINAFIKAFEIAMNTINRRD